MRIWKRLSQNSNSEMSSAGIPLRVILEILAHNDLGTLQRYISQLLKK